MMRCGDNLGPLNWKVAGIQLLGSKHSTALKSDDKYLKDINDHLYIDEKARDP